MKVKNILGRFSRAVEMALSDFLVSAYLCLYVCTSIIKGDYEKKRKVAALVIMAVPAIAAASVLWLLPMVILKPLVCIVAAGSAILAGRKLVDCYKKDDEEKLFTVRNLFNPSVVHCNKRNLEKVADCMLECWKRGMLDKFSGREKDKEVDDESKMGMFVN